MRKRLTFPKALFFYSATIILGAIGVLLTEIGDFQELLSEPFNLLTSTFYIATFAYFICLPLWLVILPYFGVFGNWQKNFSTHTLIYLNGGFGLFVSLGWAMVFEGLDDINFFLPFIISACLSGILTAVLFPSTYNQTNVSRYDQ